MSKDSSTFVFQLALVLLLSALSQGLWLGEVVWVKTWDGLSWLHSDMLSAYGVIVLAVVAMFVPLWSKRPSLLKANVSLGLMYAVSLGCYWFAKSHLYQLHSKLYFLSKPSTSSPVLQAFLPLALYAFVLGLGFFVVVRFLWTLFSLWSLVVYPLALALVLLLSYATIQVVPALNGDKDYIHVVKMGYPMFWLPLMMFVATWVSTKLKA